MASDDLETLAQLNYNMIEGHFRHVQMLSLDATRKFGSDPVLLFYKCISLLAEGKYMKKYANLQLYTVLVHYDFSSS